MRISLLTFAFIISGVVSSFGQTQDSLTSKSDLNYNILPFLRDPSSANFGFLWRLQQKSNQAIRLGLDLRFNNSTSEHNVSTISKNLNQYTGVTLGYEWQAPKNKFVLYYGPEIGASFGTNRFETNTDVPGSDIAKQISNSSQYTVAAAGFFGARWHIIPQLSLSVESAFQYGYTYSKIKLKSYSYNSSSSETHNRSHSHAVNFIPVRAIYIGYHF